MHTEMTPATTSQNFETQVSPRLVCADGSVWAIDASDPDLENYLKQQSHTTSGKAARHVA